MNFYFSLITTKNKTSIFAFNTFFYIKLKSSTGFNGVRRWVNKKDLVNKELILVSIHMETHWCLATIDFQLHQFCYYDSLLNDNRECLQLLKDYMGQKFASTIYSDWPCLFRKDIPQQLNGSDCGVLCACMQDICQSVLPFYFHNLIWM